LRISIRSADSHRALQTSKISATRCRFPTSPFVFSEDGQTADASGGKNKFKEEFSMTKVRVAGFSISLDGFGAGPEQSLENPLGKRGRELHQWFFHTRSFKAMIGQNGGSDGLDERYAHRAMDGFGAFILGRNMFGPAGNDWGGPDWKGWWGDNPPYHAPTFILTHHAQAPIEMEGGTTFIFVTEGIGAALDQAKRAAGERDVKIGGGISTVRQYLRAGSIDELHFALSPVVLGQGEAIFAGIDLPSLGYRVTEHQATEHATHIVLGR
jgi:dihydrofolate reductase